MYVKPKELGEPRSFRYNNFCFNPGNQVAKPFMNQSISSLFHEKYVLIKTNCPLFALLTYNEDNYMALIKLGILENKPFNSSHPAIYGFNVLSYVMRNLLVYNSSFEGILNEKKKHIGS